MKPLLALLTVVFLILVSQSTLVAQKNQDIVEDPARPRNQQEKLLMLASQSHPGRWVRFSTGKISFIISSASSDANVHGTPRYIKTPITQIVVEGKVYLGEGLIAVNFRTTSFSIEQRLCNQFNDAGDFIGSLFDKGKRIGYFVSQQGKTTFLPFYEARSINNKSEIAGTMLINGKRHPVMWSKGKLTDLLPASWRSSDGRTFDVLDGYATRINDLGQVFGVIRVGASADEVPTMWEGGVPISMRYQTFVANNSGHFIVQADDHCAHYESVQNGKVQDLGPLSLHAFTEKSMNDKGQVLGRALVDDTYNAHPFLWQNGVMRDIHVGKMSMFEDINNSGQIIGEVFSRGCLLEAGKITYLDKLTTLNGMSFQPFAINNKGQILTTEIFSDNHCGFAILTPKAP